MGTSAMETVFLFLLLSMLLVFDLSAGEITFYTHSLQDQAYTDETGVLRSKTHAGKRAFNLELWSGR